MHLAHFLTDLVQILRAGSLLDIHVDVVGPLPTSDGYIGWLTITDRHSSFVVTAPLGDQKATTVVQAMQQH